MSRQRQVALRLVAERCGVPAAALAVAWTSLGRG